MKNNNFLKSLVRAYLYVSVRRPSWLDGSGSLRVKNIQALAAKVFQIKHGLRPVIASEMFVSEMILEYCQFIQCATVLPYKDVKHGILSSIK